MLVHNHCVVVVMLISYFILRQKSKDGIVTSFCDHAYALPINNMPKSVLNVDEDNSGSPRKSSRIAIRQDKNGDDILEEDDDVTETKGPGRPKKGEQSPMNIRYIYFQHLLTSVLLHCDPVGYLKSKYNVNFQKRKTLKRTIHSFTNLLSAKY